MVRESFKGVVPDTNIIKLLKEVAPNTNTIQ